MAVIERTALVMHSAEQMFDLVHDVLSYPQFLPWCVDAHVQACTDTELVAGMTISKGSLQQKFTTRNQKQRPHQMGMELLDGPFEYLRGNWKFEALSEDACKVHFTLDFSVKGKILSMAMTPIFKQATSTMVDAFVKRADEIYGRK